MRGEMTLLVVHRVPLYVKHPGKSGNENPNAGFDPHVWPPSDFFIFFVSVSEHPHDLECVCLMVHSACDINIYPLYQCITSLNYSSSISMVTEGSWSSTAMRNKEMIRNIYIYNFSMHYFVCGCVCCCIWLSPYSSWYYIAHDHQVVAEYYSLNSKTAN